MPADTAYSVEPTSQDAWRLLGHYLHHRCHQDPDWRRTDHKASQLREHLVMLPVQRGQDVTVTMWLPLTTDVVVDCTDAGCLARHMYLTSDGTGRQPKSGPLPDFVVDGALAYFTYTAHPHGEYWAASVDSQAVNWMTTVLALYGGFLRVDFMDYRPESLALGHTLWRIADQELSELSRHEAVAGDGGVTEIHPIPDKHESVYPPLPPEVQARLDRSYSDGR